MPGAEGPSVVENAPPPPPEAPPETTATTLETLAAARLMSPFSPAASSVFSRASRAATRRSSRSSHLRLFWYRRVICVESSALSSAPTWSVPSSSASASETSASETSSSSSDPTPNPPRSESVSVASSSCGSVASAGAGTSAATDGGDAVPRLRSATSSPRTVRTSMATSAEASAAVRKAFEKRASAVSTIAFKFKSRPPRRPRSSVNASAASWTARAVPGGTSQEATTSPRGYPSCGLGGGRRVRIDLGGSKKEDFKIRLAPPVCRAERFLFSRGSLERRSRRCAIAVATRMARGR